MSVSPRLHGTYGIPIKEKEIWIKQKFRNKNKYWNKSFRGLNVCSIWTRDNRPYERLERKRLAVVKLALAHACVVESIGKIK